MAARTESELRRLATPEFSAVLAADPALSDLSASRYDKRAECALLLEVLGLGDWRIGAMPIRPLTPAKWAFLWVLDSPLAIGGAVTEIDLDVALYVLSIPRLGDIPGALSDIPALASGYCMATGLPSAAVLSELQALKGTAFRPLEMLPVDSSPGTDEPQYDADWITRIAGVAAREAMVPLRYAMTEMSLSTVCALYVNWRRREDVNGNQIRRRPSAELQDQISARIGELEEMFLRGKND